MGKKTGLPKKRSASSERITDLRGLSQKVKIEDSGKSSYSMMPFDIPTEFIGCSAIVKNASEKCFVNPFTEDDVQFFLGAFKNPVFRKQLCYDEKRRIIENSIDSWRRRRKHKEAYVNPIEPVLYALKLTDGILASAGNVADPEPGLLDAFAYALLPCWDTYSEEDTKIICHILVNWDWYQPLLVVIRMYQLQENYNNDEIDEIIRERKLFTPDYATVAFECLARHVTLKNAESLLKFVSKSYQSAVVTGAEIKVTKKQRDLFCNMYTYSAGMFQEELQETYMDKYRRYSDKKARAVLDKLFGIVEEPESPVVTSFYEYLGATGEKQREHYEYLVKNWDMTDGRQQGLCRNICNEELLDLVKRKTENLDGFNHGKIMMFLARSSYDKAKKFVKDRASELPKSDRRWLGCACATNLMDGTPDMDEIAEEFFLNGNSYINRMQIQRLTRIPEKSREFREAVKKLIGSISGEPEKWSMFFNSCQQLYYGDYVVTNYPTEIDGLLKMGIDYSAENGSRLIFDILGVIQNVIDRTNRDRYEKMLHRIYYEKVFPESARKRANGLYTKVYSG